MDSDDLDTRRLAAKRHAALQGIFGQWKNTAVRFQSVKLFEIVLYLVTEDVTAALAKVLDVSPKALDVPDIDSYTGLMHTLFTLEDRYGLEVCECEDEVHLRVHINKGRDAAELHRMLAAWGAVAAKLKAGEITKEEYDRWRYRYPELDTSGQWHKITPSHELSDLLLADLKEHTEE